MEIVIVVIYFLLGVIFTAANGTEGGVAWILSILLWPLVFIASILGGC